jgi:hypothetical protein
MSSTIAVTDTWELAGMLNRLPLAGVAHRVGATDEVELLEHPVDAPAVEATARVGVDQVGLVHRPHVADVAGEADLDELLDVAADHADRDRVLGDTDVGGLPGHRGLGAGDGGVGRATLPVAPTARGGERADGQQGGEQSQGVPSRRHRMELPRRRVGTYGSPVGIRGGALEPCGPGRSRRRPAPFAAPGRHRRFALVSRRAGPRGRREGDQ